MPLVCSTDLATLCLFKLLLYQGKSQTGHLLQNTTTPPQHCMHSIYTHKQRGINQNLVSTNSCMHSHHKACTHVCTHTFYYIQYLMPKSLLSSKTLQKLKTSCDQCKHRNRILSLLVLILTTSASVSFTTHTEHMQVCSIIQFTTFSV